MGGRYIDNGQYDHHVWLYRLYLTLRTDLLCYGSCFIMTTREYGIERIAPEEITINAR